MEYYEIEHKLGANINDVLSFCVATYKSLLK